MCLVCFIPRRFLRKLQKAKVGYWFTLWFLSVCFLISLIVGAYHTFHSFESTFTPTCIVAEDKDFRLPDSIVPKMYDLNFTFAEDMKTFNVSSMMELQVKIDTKCIMIHMNRSKLSNLSVQGANLKEIVDLGKDMYKLVLDRVVVRGKSLKFFLTYIGNTSIGSEQFGFVKGKSLYFTRLAPFGARNLFPCLDEPGMKAIFNVSVNIPKAYDFVFGNTAVQRVVQDVKRRVYYFEITHLLSPMQFQLLIGKSSSFSMVKTAKFASVNYSFYKMSSVSDDEIDNVLSQLEQIYSIYEIPNSLQKIDVILIKEPMDISVGSGVIITGKFQASQVVRQLIPNMDWWDSHYIFETLVHVIAKSKVTYEPAFTLLAQDSDSLNRTIKNNQDILDCYFDNVLIFKMFRIFQVLTSGMDINESISWINSILKLPFTNIHGIFQAIPKFQQEALQWINQPGYPIIRIQKLQQTQDDYAFSQSIFENNSNETTKLWWLPIEIRDSTQDVVKLRLQNQTSVLEIRSDYFFVSKNYIFWRIHYPDDLLEKFSDIIQHNSLMTTGDKLKILDDAIVLGMFDASNIEYGFDIMEALAHSTDHSIWKGIFFYLRFIDSLLSGRTTALNFFRFCRYLLKRYDWKKHSLSESLNTITGDILTQLAYFDSQEEIEYAFSLYNSGNIPAHLQKFVYHTVVQKGGEKEFYEIRKLDPPGALQALCQTKVPSLVSFLLEESLTSDDGYDILICLSKQRTNGLVWQFLREHYQTYLERIPEIKILTQVNFFLLYSFSHQINYREIEDFFRASSSFHIGRILNTVQRNLKFFQDHQSGIGQLENWLKNRWS